MKHLKLVPVLVLAACAAMAPRGYGQLTINYDFTPNAVVPDNGQYASAQTLGGLSGLSSFSNVAARLNLSSANAADPMYLGDMYSSLTFGQSGEAQRIAVLVNRPGVDNANAFGSSLSALNVKLDDSTATTNIYNATTSTGTYNSDGRLGVNPYGAGTAYSSGDRTNTLATLVGNGDPLASNRVSLLVADTSQGGTATLSGWGVSVTGTAASMGTFAPGANASISDTGAGATNLVGATLDLTGTAAGGLVINLAGTTTLAGGVTGAGGINKTGAGTLTLSAAGSYTGGTALNAGTLLVNGGTAGTSSGTGTGNVTVNNSGTLLGGSGAISGSVNFTGAGTLSPGATGAAGSVGTLATGALTLASASTLAFDINSTASKDALALGGHALTLGGAALALNLGPSFDYGQTYAIATGVTGVSGSFGSVTGYDNINFSPVFTLNGTEFDLTFIPEPATVVGGMLLVGTAVWSARRRVRGMFIGWRSKTLA